MSQLTTTEKLGQVATQAADDHAASSAARQAKATPGIISDLMTLTKVRITLMVALTGFVGFVLGAAALPATLGQLWAPLLGTLLGTSISCMGASVLNQAYEVDTDAKMDRTRDRPLPTGRVGLLAATLLGVALSLVGVGLLALTTYPLAAVLSAATILSYVLIYTPLKRRTSLALLIGAAPGAAPPLIGYAAATGTLGVEAWLCFAIMFVWQVPHFLAIAWLYREDYAKAAMPMLPVIDPDGQRTFRQVFISCLLLMPLGMGPAYIGVSGLFYLITALICGGLFLLLGVQLMRLGTRAAARNLFLASLIYLPVIFTVMLLDTV